MLKAIKTEASLTRESNKMTLFEDIFSSNNLRMAWEHVRKNKGSAGCDGVTIDDYPYWAKAHWTGIKRGLYEGIYCPQPVRRVEIPKPTGGIRLLGIPCVNDRVIQQAIAQQLNWFIDPTFSEHSYGFRPMRSAHQAIKAVQAQIKAKRRYAVDIDLSKFFDEVDHDILMHRLSQRINDKQVLALIGKILRAGVSIHGKIEATSRGVPQGSPLSPLLANIMLDDLDRFLEKKQYPFARYADDFVISVKTLKEGQRIMQEVTVFLKTLKLPINEEKSQVVRSSELTFLGYSFRGRFLLWSQKSLKNFKYRIRQLTSRRWSVSWDYRYRKLKEYLTGWMNYFSLSIYDPVLQLDSWIRRRIRACYLKQWRKPRTKIRHLIHLGVPLKLAISIGVSSKKYYRLAKTKAMQMGLTKQWLKAQGLVSLRAALSR
jgi:RNA-directed DNA polymerase